MIACVSPSSNNMEESLNCLRYANRAKNIKMRVQANKKMVYLHVSAYKSIISDLKEGVFFARIVCSKDGKTIEIDARPSDAIAIGLRFNVNIYTHETILTEAGIVLTDENEEIVTVEEAVASGDEPAPKKIKDQPTDKLNEMLSEALRAEDYERAAEIRDELNRRN